MKDVVGRVEKHRGYGPLLYGVLNNQNFRDALYTGLERNNRYNEALGFGSDVVAPIEQNRRRSRATSRILRLRRGKRWPEDEMHNLMVIS
jgi:hypothetical protein